MSRLVPVAALACASFWSACSTESSSSPTTTGEVLLDAGAPDAARPVDLEDIADRPLDSLARTEAIALCLNDMEAADPCMEYGLLERAEAECEATVEVCRGTLVPSDPELMCANASFDPLERCDVTVEQYTRCLAAWRETQRCTNAGKMIATPEACIPVVSTCDRFASSFFQDGTPPSCPEAQGTPEDPRADEYGFDGCRPAPERLVILGDSIAACWILPDEICGPLLIGQHLKDTVAPGLVVESVARSGAFVEELPAQAADVAGGPGHVLVWIFAIGNDLATDQTTNYPVWEPAFADVFAYFRDDTRFSGGATFLLNTQYSPYDQCPDPPGPSGGISMEIEQLLQDVNRRMFLDVAELNDDVVALDHYRPWLGHGVNANNAYCPHCGADNTNWMFDNSHPSDVGYREMAARWSATLDAMYAPECRP